MTVAQLQEFLKDKPQDAELFFTLWTESGAKNWWFNPTMGKKVYDGKNGQFVQIAYVDDCPAQRLIETEDSTMLYYGEKK